MSDVISDLKYIRFAMNYTCSVQEAKDAYETNGRDADKTLAYLKEKYPPKKIMPAESIDKPKNNDKDKKFWTKKKIICSLIAFAFSVLFVVLLALHINDKTPWIAVLLILATSISVGFLLFVLFHESREKYSSNYTPAYKECDPDKEARKELRSMKRWMIFAFALHMVKSFYKGLTKKK